MDFAANKFEIARILGARALQISFGAPPLIPVDLENSPIEISKLEFKTGIIPLEVIVG